jgi:hypothetical protein
MKLILMQFWLSLNELSQSSDKRMRVVMKGLALGDEDCLTKGVDLLLETHESNYLNTIRGCGEGER